MRSRAGIEKLLRRIMETGGLTEDMERDVKDLQDEFDEREGMLRRYGEIRDGEDGETATFEERTDSTEKENTELESESREGEVATEEPINWEARYNELQTRYLDRFFNGSSEERRDRESAEKTRDEIISNQDSDVLRDGEVQSFDELLYRVEDDDNGGRREY